MSAQSFGLFLLGKRTASGTLGELAQAAARDPAFPKNGSPEQISRLLNRHQAPAEFHDALDDAEAEWRATLQ